MFNSRHELLIAAILASEDKAGDRDSPYRHRLTIYVRGIEIPAEAVAILQAGAKRAVVKMYNYPGLPKDRFSGTEVYLAARGSREWRQVPVPEPAGETDISRLSFWND